MGEKPGKIQATLIEQLSLSFYVFTFNTQLALFQARFKTAYKIA